MSNYDPYAQGHNQPAGQGNPPQPQQPPQAPQLNSPPSFHEASPAYQASAPTATSTYGSAWPQPEKKSNKGLIIGLSVGGGLLVLLAIMVVLAVVFVNTFRADDSGRGTDPVPPVATSQPTDPSQTDDPGTPATTEPATDPSAGGAWDSIPPVASTSDAQLDTAFNQVFAEYSSPNSGDQMPFEQDEARGFGLQVCNLMQAGDEAGFVALFDSLPREFAYAAGYTAGAASSIYCPDYSEQLLEWATSNGL